MANNIFLVFDKYLEFSDLSNGLIKASIFGLILSWVGCYKGYYTLGGRARRWTIDNTKRSNWIDYDFNCKLFFNRNAFLKGNHDD